jgi:hypothetical protein
MRAGTRVWLTRLVLLIGGLGYAISTLGMLVMMILVLVGTEMMIGTVLVVWCPWEPVRDALGLATLLTMALTARYVVLKFCAVK